MKKNILYFYNLILQLDNSHMKVKINIIYSKDFNSKLITHDGAHKIYMYIQ